MASAGSTRKTLIVHALLQSHFDAGRKVGRQEAYEEVRRQLDQILAGADAVLKASDCSQPDPEDGEPLPDDPARADV